MPPDWAPDEEACIWAGISAERDTRNITELNWLPESIVSPQDT